MRALSSVSTGEGSSYEHLPLTVQLPGRQVNPVRLLRMIARLRAHVDFGTQESHVFASLQVPGRIHQWWELLSLPDSLESFFL